MAKYFMSKPLALPHLGQSTVELIDRRKCTHNRKMVCNDVRFKEFDDIISGVLHKISDVSRQYEKLLV